MIVSRDQLFGSLPYLLLGLFIGLTISVLAFQTPTQNPPGGSGAIYVAAGTVYVTQPTRIQGTTTVEVGRFGVGVASPAGLLDVGGGSLIVVSAGGNVGVGTTNPGAKLEINGGLRLNTSASKPSCDASQGGTLWFSQGGVGAKDTLEICAKDASDAYSWRLLY